MKKKGKFIYWTPRILSLFFIAFLTLFSLDVFGNGYTFWQTMLALFMHNLPSLLLSIVLILSWKHEIVGGIAFILAGIAYIISILITAINNGFEWYYLAWAIQISGIAFLIGILFLIGWFKKKNKDYNRFA
ncbi:MAG: hypothetical protein AABX04_06880 [Nanoarchaeota archaeon]